jgi:hypothetical protein
MNIEHVAKILSALKECCNAQYNVRSYGYSSFASQACIGVEYDGSIGKLFADMVHFVNFDISDYADQKDDWFETLESMMKYGEDASMGRSRILYWRGIAWDDKFDCLMDPEMMEFDDTEFCTKCGMLHEECECEIRPSV